MYGCFDGAIVYGVLEPSENKLIDKEWLRTRFPTVRTFASGVVRNFMCEPVYGDVCELKEDGSVVPLDVGSRGEIDRLAAVLGVKAGYQVALYGDYELCHEVYTPFAQSSD